MSIIELKEQITKSKDRESALIKAAKSGSADAFEQLILGLEGKMYQVALSLAISADQADDIYQEAMLSAFKALPKFRMESQFSTWLYRIVVNTSVSYKRKIFSKLASLMSQENDEIDGYANNTGSQAESPEAILSNRQVKLAINKALKQLAEKERIAFVLCHEQGLKIHHVANIMDVTDGAVKSYLFRAREKMKVQLQDFMR